jgi:AhpD family alkylhydroperoxidase
VAQFLATYLGEDRNDNRATLSFWRIAVDKLKELTRRRKQAHAELLALDSKVYKAFLALEQAAFSDGVLPKRAKELIAIGISVVINCESCMQWHIEQAASAGASKREVLEALEVGIEMGGGPATAHARFALAVMASVFPPAPVQEDGGKTASLSSQDDLRS